MFATFHKLEQHLRYLSLAYSQASIVTALMSMHLDTPIRTAKGFSLHAEVMSIATNTNLSCTSSKGRVFNGLWIGRAKAATAVLALAVIKY